MAVVCNISKFSDTQNERDVDALFVWSMEFASEIDLNRDYYRM